MPMTRRERSHSQVRIYIYRRPLRAFAYSTARFILNGLVQANKILGENIFDVKDWTVIGEYVYDTQGGRHQAFYSPNRDIVVQDVLIKAGERVKVEVSLKYSPEETAKLFEDAGMREVQKWSASSDEYSKYRIMFVFLCFGLVRQLHMLDSTGQYTWSYDHRIPQCGGQLPIVVLWRIP